MRNGKVGRAAAMLLSLAGFALPGVPLASPALVIDPASVELGLLEGDVTVPFGFTLRNDGDETLIIEEVNPTCGCTVVFLTDSLLAPGELVPLTGAFSSRKMEGDVRKVILLSTNDPARPRAVASLHAWVQRELTLSDETIDFGAFEPDLAREERILIRPGKEIELVITGIEAPPERYRCWITEGELPGERVLHVSLFPQREGTVLADTVYVRTNVEDHETIHLPVRGHARGKRPEGREDD